MINNIIKAATCQVSCGSESGTGHLITESHVLTARHCIVSAIDSGSEVNLTFSDSESHITASIIADSEELDVCILSIPESLGYQIIPLNASMPREGEEWLSFGYPIGKTKIGHRIAGTIAHCLDVPKCKIDIDLAVNSEAVLTDYKGLSGASLVCENTIRGLIRLKLNGSLGAISIKRLQKFLKDNGIQVPESSTEEDASVEPSNRLAVRGEFQETFEQMLLQNSGDYVFLEGAHGIGKTTFCSEFQSDNKKLFILGAYSFASSGRNPGAIYQAQPEVFFDWLSTTVSTLVFKKPSRKEENLSYIKLVSQTSALFDAFAKYCETKNQQGILFLDGLNEAQIADSDALKKLLGLLPQPLPQAITIVLTAPNYQTVALLLARRVKNQNVISLPPLSDEASSDYCWQELVEHRANPKLIAHICQKAQGHPLYLRYLIEYANNSPEEDALDDFPVLTGTIEEYYESLWQRLLEDAHSINLLAIIARLRWGIGINDLTKILRPEEQIAFTSTISRIRHLLLNTDTTTIYHPSFAEFLVSKTDDLKQVIQKRLSEFCIRESQLEYCVLNRVFHLLRSDETDQSQAVVDCNQKWVDTCVTLEVEPDTLLFDIEKTLDAAANMGFAVEVIRLLLLSQRVSFRYNVLFAQSARLIAEALIALKRPKEALKHVIRFNTLIIAHQEALQIAFCLIQNNYQEEALKILELLHQKILEAHDFNEIELQNFIHICKLHLQTILFMCLADGYGRMRQVSNILYHAAQVCITVLTDTPPEHLVEYLAPVDSVVTNYFLSFRDAYPGLKKLKEKGPEVPLIYFFLRIIWVLFECESSLDEYNLPRDIKSLPQVFSDIEELIIAGVSFDKRLVPEIVDSLIQLGAPSSTVKLISDKGEKLTFQTIKIRKDNGVDVDFLSISQVSVQWRTTAFLSSDFNCPLVGAFDDTNWLTSLEQLIGTLSWCEGKVRRAKADKDENLQRESLQFLQARVLQPLAFSLAQRVEWQNSYAIPESIFPHLYERITVLLMDCYPEEMAIFLDNLSNRAVDQLGLYTEGFRDVMFAVFHKFTTQEIEASLLENVLKLLQQWKEHVICGVENRHELIPELLRLIPIFVKVGADEEADSLYQHMLSVSMGPSWYKEDQLGLMVSTLRRMPPSDNVQAELPLVAGYLERASGEMTFQRFIRYEKMFLIGELFRRKNFSSGCRYFKRQVCGSATELQSESQQSIIDKPSPTIGMRHPGGALDEQQAVLEMVRNSEGIDWRLRWTLLEIFQCGDERHFDDYVTEYAQIINQAGIDDSVVSDMISRIEFVIGAEIDPKQRSQFLNIFSKELNKNFHSAFSKFIVQVSTTDTLGEYSNEITSNSQDSESTDRDGILYMPGTFGYPSAMKEAESELREAEKQLKLRNLVSAKKQAAKVLQILQDSGWSIWGDMLGKTHRDAENLLRQQANTPTDLIRFYVPLIAAERYDSKWKIAEHLITKIADLLGENERSQLLQYAINHVNLMVGDATNEIAMFDFLAEESHCKASIELFSFILWILDHPEWLRRNKAAGMVAWLVNSDSIYLELAVKEAFSMATGYSADIFCGVLDDMSMRQPQQFWNQIFPLLDLEYILQNCKHVSRLSVLHRIAERARKIGSSTGITVASSIEEKFRSGKIELADSDIDFDFLIPNWSSCIEREWKILDQFGLVTKELVMALEEKMSETCAPLTIQENWNIEDAVSTSFREKQSWFLNRWEAKVRFALNTALFPYVSQRDFMKIESLLRVFNPSLPERTLIPGFSSLSDAIFKSISSRKDYSGAIGNKEFFFLNYYGMMEQGKRDDWVSIEILAIVVPSFVTNGILQLSQKKYFSSTELPNFNSGSTDHETCWHLKPDLAFFGSFTPAYPLPDFKRLIKAKDDDFLRINWRNGKSSEVRFCGRPIQEGCLLAVKREAVNLPEGKKLAWLIQMNGKLITVVDSQNNRLIYG